MNQEEEQRILKRINELYHLKQTRPLTTEEAEERKTLHQQFIRNFRAGFKQQLDDLVIYDQDGHEITAEKAKAAQREKGLRKD